MTTCTENGPKAWLGRERLNKAAALCCSAGVLLLQLAVPELRAGTALRNLNIELEAAGFDLKKWR